MRQMIEDELRRVGMRLRDLDVRLELGLQESVTSAVQAGYGVTFISRHVGRGRPRRGHARGGARRGARARARDLPRARERPRRDARRPRVRRVRARAARVIVRWSLAELPGRARRARPRAAAARRERALGRARRCRAPRAGRRCRRDRIEVPPEADCAARRRRRLGDRHRARRVRGDGPAGRVGADDVLGRRVDADASASARPDRRMVGGGGGANLAAIVYESALTLDLPRAETVGTALNALAHCAEALYVARPERRRRRARARGRGADRRRAAARRRRAARRRGARPSCCAAPRAPARRSRSPASASGTRSRRRSAARYGLPHGAMNALALPPALRFNAPVAPEAVARFGAAIGAPDDPAAKVEELARLGGFERLARLRRPRGGSARGRRGRSGAARQPRTTRARRRRPRSRSFFTRSTR